ncbi:single-stranded DNA-binding protein [Dissulfuribacter thermophilus]|nr:single-stranded DNA-binding protein [Dissulfuribacter thermophilus]
MVKSVNKVILIGRLGADPEIRYTQAGTPVASFRIATNNRIKRGEEWVEEPEWHRIVAWNKLAEICEQYLKKGMLVYIEGQLRTRAWEDQDGNRRWTTEVHAREMQMLESKGSGSMEESELEPPPIDEDDVPF